MTLEFNRKLASGYHSNSQLARVLTEAWVKDNMYCPRCGSLKLEHFENNRPVADFFCPDCNNQFELKSKNGPIGKKIADGAYDTMIARITGNNNPDFFLMNYSLQCMQVVDFALVPKYFFHPNMVERRKPLADTARRNGWVGCNILMNRVPCQGIIQIVSEGSIIDRNTVLKKVTQSNQLALKDIDSRGWLFDILECINKIPTIQFSLRDVYYFESILQMKHPDNHNINAKIRQQLQFLRDKGVIKFLGNGQYRKTNY